MNCQGIELALIALFNFKNIQILRISSCTKKMLQNNFEKWTRYLKMISV